MVIILSVLFQTGFQYKETFNVSIVSVSFDETTRILRYDIKITNPPHQSLSEDINLAIKPGKDLERLMVTDPHKISELNMIGGSADIESNIGRFRLEYKVKENVESGEVTFFAFNSTLLILKEEKIQEKVNLRKYKDTYFPLQHPISNLVGVLDEKTN